MIVSGALLAMLSVIMGAFAAHGLRQMLDAYALGIVDTSARYQMYHALALVLAGVASMSPGISMRWLKIAAAAFIVGIVLFSGSLYLLALSGARWWGTITPVGGVAFILGWIALALAALKK